MRPEEIAEIQEMLDVYVNKMGSQVVKKFANIPEGWKFLKALSKEGKIVEFYDHDKFCGILAFDVGEDWWSGDTKMLVEVVVLSCLGVHGLQREVCKMLDKLAKEYQAQMIVSGCFFLQMPQVVSNGYKKYGFNQTYPTYVKVMNNDD